MFRLTLDAALYMLTPACGATSCIGFLDQAGNDESGTFTVTAGHRYFIVVDGYKTGEDGIFTLRVD